jgi:regulator of RNase E activity RraA
MNDTSPLWESDESLFKLIQTELFSSVIGDVLDTLGFEHQFLPPDLKPNKPEIFLTGRALTVQETDCSTIDGHIKEEQTAFGKMFDALDAIQPGDIYVCTGSKEPYACWGELMSTRAKLLGGRGAVVEGYSRDTKGVWKLDFPSFSKGFYGQDQKFRGEVTDWNCPITFSSGVTVTPGDLIIGDIDGIVVVPKQIEKEAITAALQKVRAESMVAKKIREGMPTREVWSTYGVM